MTTHRRLLLAAPAALLLPAPAHAGLFNPPSVDQQKKLGRDAAQQITKQYKEVFDGRARHFNQIGQRLVAALPAHGTLYTDSALTQAVAAGATFTGATLYFKPDANWNGNTSFGYVALDNAGTASSSAQASSSRRTASSAARPCTL